MAHPLTQYPPSTLPFPSAPRPSPLGFGFGLPSTSSPSSLPFGSPSRAPFSSTNGGSLGFGFAASPSFNAHSLTPGGGGINAGPSFGSPKRTQRPGPSPSPSTYRSATTPSLKRARRSISPDSVSSSGGSNNASSPSSPAATLPKKHKEDIPVGQLALGGAGDGRKVIRKDAKRSRKEAEAVSKAPSGIGGGSDVDVGVLLATLPPSAHLNILLNLVTAHPELGAEILDKLPQPELNECLHQLEKQLEKIKKGVGFSTIQLNPERLWTRVQKDVEAYTRIASTYLSFVTSPPHTSTPPDPQAIQSLLYALSTQITYILRLIPSSANTSTGPSGTLLNLGKTVISSWTTWLSTVSAEVNQRSGMFPNSTVQTWSNNLDTLANAQTQSQASQQAPSPFGWGSYPQPTAAAETPHPLVDSFRGAMGPIRDRFVTELGWLIGRHANLTSGFAFGTATSWGHGVAHGVGGVQATQASQSEDTDL